MFSGGGIILPSDLAVRKWDSGKVIAILKQDENCPLLIKRSPGYQSKR
jgi:hypothetical protein